MKKQNLWNDLMDWDDPKEDEKSLILKKEGELKAYHIMQFLLLIVFLFSLFLNDSMLAANQRQLLFLIFFLFLINNSVSVFISCFQGTVGILDKKGGRSSVFFSCLLSDFLILASVAYMRSDTAYEIIYNHSYYWVIIAFLLLIIPLLLFALYSSAYRHHLSSAEKEEYGRKKIVIVIIRLSAKGTDGVMKHFKLHLPFVPFSCYSPIVGCWHTTEPEEVSGGAV